MHFAMSNYFVIKTLMVLALITLGIFVLRPVRNANQLAIRRICMLLLFLFAIYAVIFPNMLNKIASMLHVERGVNLLLYALVLAFFMQVVSSYRRDSDMEKRLTKLARAVALAPHPPLPHHQNYHETGSEPKAPETHS